MSILGSSFHVDMPIKIEGNRKGYDGLSASSLGHLYACHSCPRFGDQSCAFQARYFVGI